MANFTSQKNQDFITDLIDRYPLDRIAEWIADNCEPEEVFTEEQLVAWAERNDFTRED